MFIVFVHCMSSPIK